MTRIPIALLALGLVASGCNKKAKYIDPDAEAKVEGTGLESRDIRAIVGEMTKELLASPSIAGFEGVPRIAVLPVENRTRFLIDQDIFTTLITEWTSCITPYIGQVAAIIWFILFASWGGFRYFY